VKSGFSEGLAVPAPLVTPDIDIIWYGNCVGYQ
jgi:hypothetical protein